MASGPSVCHCTPQGLTPDALPAGRPPSPQDAHEHLATRSPSYSGGTHSGMIGDGNPVKRVCAALVEQVGTGAGGEPLTFASATASLRDAGFPGAGPTADADQLRAALQSLDLPGGQPPLIETQIEDLVAVAQPDSDGRIFIEMPVLTFLRVYCLYFRRNPSGLHPYRPWRDAPVVCSPQFLVL